MEIRILLTRSRVGWDLWRDKAGQDGKDNMDDNILPSHEFRLQYVCLRRNAMKSGVAL